MGSNLDIVSCIPRRSIDESFLINLITIMKENGCTYDGGYYYNPDDEWIFEDISEDFSVEKLSEGIKITAKQGNGAIDFECQFDEESWTGFLSIHQHPLDKKWITVEFVSPSGYYYQHKKAVERFIELGKSLYEHLKPFVSYMFNDYDRIFPSSEELNSVINEVAGFTFFSPQLIDRIGRKNILSAPAYKIEVLSDGGILMNIDNNLLGGSNVEKVEKHLGLKGPSTSRFP